MRNTWTIPSVLLSKNTLLIVFTLFGATFSLSPSTAILIYDIDTAYLPLVDDSVSEKPSPHLRIVTFDTLKQKITHVWYLPYKDHSPALCTSHPDFKICYGPLHGPTLSLDIIPNARRSFWIRSYGKIKSHPSYLKLLRTWDKSQDKKDWVLYIGDHKGPTQLDLPHLRMRINALDAEARIKTTHPCQKNPHWKKRYASPLEISYGNPKNLHSIFSPQRDLGNLGECATDLLMLSFGLVKHEGKYGSNQGFDGIYSSENEGFWIVSEAKWWKSCPNLDRIESEYLISKFDEKNTRAITKIDPSLKVKLLHAQDRSQLYLLPLGVFPNGQIYTRLRQKSVESVSSRDNSRVTRCPAQKDHGTMQTLRNFLCTLVTWFRSFLEKPCLS